MSWTLHHPQPGPPGPGHEAIDAQHRQMTALFVALREAAAADPHDPRLHDYLEELQRLAEAHFRDEEAAMRCAPEGAGRYAAHMAQHQTLLYELAKLRDEAAHSAAGVGPAVLSALERWLFEHVNTFDRDLPEPLVRPGESPPEWLEADS